MRGLQMGMFLMGCFWWWIWHICLKKRKSHLWAAVCLEKQLYNYWQPPMLINFANNEESTKSIQKAPKSKSGTWESTSKEPAGKHVRITGRWGPRTNRGGNGKGTWVSDGGDASTPHPHHPHTDYHTLHVPRHCWPPQFNAIPIQYLSKEGRKHGRQFN